jgi:hypothetical protein
MTMKATALFQRILFISGLLLAASGISQTLVQTKIDLENSLNGQLRSELKSILPEDAFGIFTSVNMQVKSVRELTQGEVVTTKPQSLPQPNEPVQEDLPGFDASNQEAAATAPTPSSEEHQTFRMVDKPEIVSVAVKLVVDQSVSSELTETAKSILSQRIVGSFGQKGTVSVTQTKLLKSENKNLPHGQHQKPFEDPIGPILSAIQSHFMKIVALALGLMSLLFLYRKLISPRRAAVANHQKGHTDYIDVTPQPSQQSPQQHPRTALHAAAPYGHLPALGHVPPSHFPNYALPPGYSGFDPSANDGLASQNSMPPHQNLLALEIDQLLLLFTERPLEARSYLRQLGESELDFLIAAFPSRTMQRIIHHVARPGVPFISENTDNSSASQSAPNSDETCNRLRGIRIDFSRFLNVQKVHEGRPLYKLSLLTADEINQLMEGLPLESRAGLLKIMNREQAAQVLRNWDQQLRSSVAPLLASGVKLSPELINTLEITVAHQAEEAGKRLFADYCDDNDLLDMLMVDAENPTEIYKNLASQGNVPSKKLQHLSKYSVGVDDILKIDNQKLILLFDHLSNDALAATLTGMDEMRRQELLSSLPQLRRSLVLNLITKLSKPENVNLTQSLQREIVASYLKSPQINGGISI